MKEIKRRYTNGEITVLWQPALCIHSTNCFTGLIEVFDPAKRPWVNINGASTQRIIEQVKKCPSSALSYFLNRFDEDETESDKIEKQELEINKIERTQLDDNKAKSLGALRFYLNKYAEKELDKAETIVEIIENGPLLVYGNIIFKDLNGKETKYDNVTAFCRCGKSANNPFCDGSHLKK